MTRTPAAAPLAADRASWPALSGMFLTAASVLLLEIALTRVFAILLWHHFAYMVVSLALLGFGASGSLLTAFRGAGQDAGGRTRSGAWALAYGVAVVLAFFAVTRIRIDSLEIWKEPANFFWLFATYAVLSVPFLLAGMAIGATLNRHPAQVGKLYFADLLGSAAGGALAPLLLDASGSTVTVLIAAALGGLGAFAFSGGRPVLLAPAAATLGLAAAFGGGLLHWEIPFAPHKGAGAMYGGVQSERTLHSATAQVDVFEPVEAQVMIGGQFGDLGQQTARLRAVTQDGTAPTALHENAADLARFPCLDDSQAGSAYVALRASGRKPEEVLVIGCGGGIDVMVALAQGAGRVTAVDVNKAMIRMVRTEYDDFLGGLFRNPRVDLVHAEGRSFLRHSGRRFDVIQLSGVDTFTALSTGAYTLSESYLYTAEAVRDFYEHLEEGGIVTWSRFMLTWPNAPRETIRLAHVARTALDGLGIAEPWRHIAVLQAHDAASTMVKKGPFTEAEIAALREFAARENFMGLVFDPLRPEGAPYARGRVPGWQLAASLRDVRTLGGTIPDPGSAHPVVARCEAAYVAAVELALAGDAEGSAAALAEIPRQLGSDPEDSARSLAFLEAHRDAFVGVRAKKNEGFIDAQRNFETLVRGAPAARDALVRDYIYDLSPSTDDRPFFFDYFRLGKFWEYWRSGAGWTAEYHPGFPVGHMVILSSLAQILFLAAVLILLPLRRLRSLGVAAPRRLRTFAYFAALGLGFMFVEIGLMQKFILFLGHPTHSLSVVLCGMLAFSGFGALWSSRIRRLDRRSMNRLLLAVVALIALEALAAALVLPALLGLPFAARVAVTLALLAPMAFALGIPFPLGIRMLERGAPALVPWGWAVNGFLSVFASMLTTLLAMQAGFTAVLLVAAAIYAAGIALAPLPDVGPGAEGARA